MLINLIAKYRADATALFQRGGGSIGDKSHGSSRFMNHVLIDSSSISEIFILFTDSKYISDLILKISSTILFRFSIGNNNVWSIFYNTLKSRWIYQMYSSEITCWSYSYAIRRWIGIFKSTLDIEYMNRTNNKRNNSILYI